MGKKIEIRGAQIFQKCRSNLKILCAWSVTWSKSHTDDPQIIGAEAQNVVTTATWNPGFVHHCSKCKRQLVMVRVREPVWEIVGILHWWQTLCRGVPYQWGSPVHVLSAGIVTMPSGSPHLLFLPTVARLHSFSPCAIVCADWQYHSTEGVITKGSCMGARIACVQCRLTLVGPHYELASCHISVLLPAVCGIKAHDV